MKRRDLLEASKLLVRHKLLKPGEMDQTALMLGVSYIQDKREGGTDLDFPAWLDEDVNEEDLFNDDDGEAPADADVADAEAAPEPAEEVIDADATVSAPDPT